MPRQPRITGNTGIYHVMIRGVNKMDIFLDNLDRIRFIETLIKMNAEGEFALYGYCLMSNHVHLLIKEENDPLYRTMKRIGISYSYYFNKKYKRVGHLFQDRFKSERIETENSILACIRYIHNNPVKAYIIDNPSEYKWSSYNIYIGKAENEEKIIDVDFILEMFAESKEQAIRRFSEFSIATSYEEFLEMEEENSQELKPNSAKIADEIAEKYKLTLCELQRLKDKNIRDKIIREIKENTKLSIREIEGLTGISRSTISRVTR